MTPDPTIESATTSFITAGIPEPDALRLASSLARQGLLTRDMVDACVRAANTTTEEQQVTRTPDTAAAIARTAFAEMTAAIGWELDRG